SLRIRPLSATVIRAVAESGAQTVSVAPEAGSERLRQLINKCVTEDDIIRAIDTISDVGLRQIKLYFMIGLPTETDDDIEEIIRLTLDAKSRIEKTGCRIALTVEPFVPKAGTPFQWLAMAGSGDLERRTRRIKSGLAGSGIEVRAESVGWSLVQGVLSRGDVRLGAALASMPENSLAAWRQALAQHDLSAEHYIHRELPLGEPLPWSVVDSGVATSYFRDELDKAWRGGQTAACPPQDCSKCGVC
ncbi:MAG: radical SAM protein, partial [Dehalococcoidia bacterium]